MKLWSNPLLRPVIPQIYEALVIRSQYIEYIKLWSNPLLRPVIPLIKLWSNPLLRPVIPLIYKALE